MYYEDTRLISLCELEDALYKVKEYFNKDGEYFFGAEPYLENKSIEIVKLLDRLIVVSIAGDKKEHFEFLLKEDIEEQVALFNLYLVKNFSFMLGLNSLNSHGISKSLSTDNLREKEKLVSYGKVFFLDDVMYMPCANYELHDWFGNHPFDDAKEPGDHLLDHIKMFPLSEVKKIVISEKPNDHTGEISICFHYPSEIETISGTHGLFHREPKSTPIEKEHHYELSANEFKEKILTA